MADVNYKTDAGIAAVLPNVPNDANQMPAAVLMAPIVTSGVITGYKPLAGTYDATTGTFTLDVNASLSVSGVATETTLAAMSAKVPALGQALAAGSVPVVLTAAQLASLTPPAAITGYATQATLAQLDGKVTACNTGAIAGSVTANAGTNLNTSALALETGGNLASIKAKTDNIPALGQALAAASAPVVLPEAQITTLTPPAAITGFALEATLGTLSGKVTACDTGNVTVVTLPALPAGTNNIGDVDIASALPAGTNNIGDVDLASAIPAGTNIIGKLGIDQTTPGTTNGVQVNAALPAGTNAIGKLAANSGVDIGDVDVTSLPGAIQGPGNPTVYSYAHAVVDLAASTANQQIVAAPGASKEIWVYGFQMTADTAAGTVVFQDEDDTALSGTFAFSDEGGISVSPSGNFAMPLFKVATNKALEADTGANTVDGIIQYAIVSV